MRGWSWGEGEGNGMSQQQQDALTVFHVERSKGSGLSNQQARAEVYDLFRGGRGKGTTCLTWTCLLCSTWSGSSARTRKDLGWGHACLTHEKHFLE